MSWRITTRSLLTVASLVGLAAAVACDGGDQVERSGLESRGPEGAQAWLDAPAPGPAFATLSDEAAASLLEPAEPAAAAPTSAPAGSPTPLSDRLERPSCAEPQPTSKIRLALSLDASAELARGAFDPLAPWHTAQAGVPMVVYGPSSACVGLDLYLRRVDADAWAWWLVVDGRYLRDGVYGLPTTIGTGSLRFDAAGDLIAEHGGQLSVAPASPQRPWSLQLDFTDTFLAPGPSQAERVLFDGCYETGAEACL